MKTFLIIIITVILTIIIWTGIVTAVIWYANPFSVKDLVVKGVLTEIFLGGNIQLSAGFTDYNHPLLTADQENTLRDMNIDPSTLPTSISPEMETCFRAVLGDKRVDEIIGGTAPSILDVMKGQSCF
ncbi:MAG TPA: hypothetical protein VJB67_01255 [Patescibacteria group bacterium]|nr:hypothetical protein [Patescibacteria group bacterium]